MSSGDQTFQDICEKMDCRLDPRNTAKMRLALEIAKELNCPCTYKDLRNVYTFLNQLAGIQRANALARTMGIDPIDFSCKQTTIKEYLENETYQKECE